MSIVYFVQSGDFGPIKIGFTMYLPKRMMQLQCGSPHRLTVLLTVDGSASLESAFHKSLSEYRISGEWFSPTGEVFNAINRARLGVYPEHRGCLDGMMTNHIAMIDHLGGTTATAKAIGVPISTVHSWRLAGKIPAWRLPAMHAAIAQVPASHPPSGD